jgi:hypothetical protein
MTRVQFPGGAVMGFFLFVTTSRPALGPPTPPSNGYQELSPGVKQTTHFHLVLRLRMCRAIPPFSQYIFMACLVKPRDNFTFILKNNHKEKIFNV